MTSKWLPYLYLVFHLLRMTQCFKNTVIGVNAVCDEDRLNVTLLFAEEFRGVVFSKGSGRGCRAGGRPGSPRATLSLAPPLCGLTVTKDQESGRLVLSAVLEVQMSPSLQQADDPALPISCPLQEGSLPLRSTRHHPNARRGRGMSGGVGRAWMEVKGSAAPARRPPQPLSVGEHTTLAIYTSLPEGLYGQPVHCAVHDGHGTRQPLSDAAGCPLEPTLVPRLRYEEESGTWATGFPAFSFPDSQLVHYTCKLRICRSPCPQSECESDEVNSTRISRNYQEVEVAGGGGGGGGVVDVVELYNSVEVTAPNIELGYLKREPQLDDSQQQGDGGSSGGGSGGRSSGGGGGLCLPGRGVALALGAAGCLFLSALLAALTTLVRRRVSRPRSRPPFLLLRSPSPASLWSI